MHPIQMAAQRLHLEFLLAEEKRGAHQEMEEMAVLAAERDSMVAAETEALMEAAAAEVIVVTLEETAGNMEAAELEDPANLAVLAVNMEAMVLVQVGMLKTGQLRECQTFIHLK